MPLKNDHYTYRVTWSEEDNEYVGLCVEFPSLSWLSKTPESALKGIRNVVSEIVMDMKKHMEDVPQPIANKNYSGLGSREPRSSKSLIRQVRVAPGSVKS